MTVNERFGLIIKHLYGGNKSAFANAIGVTPSVIENVVGKRQGKPSFEVLEKISALAQVNIDWLISGNGSMLIDEDMQISNETRPRIPLEAAAGSLSIIAQSVYASACELLPVISRFHKYDFTIMIKGDSMEPEFHSGDEVACRLIDQPSFIQWGRTYILDTHQGIVIKRIYNRADTILCKSENPDYEDFEVPKDEILHIALVVGSIRLY